ncbi:hypothetical protein [Sphaerisporangium perillae]|uniref:hypothetical protein n=1 Tax=Sphaerisporangium perillae TaxID=2935860 RepID=UPI00200D55B0|nr:hypothetical protein [Sphaerisporangium perillae]
MLKRLLFAVALAASTLLVTGTVTGTAQASEPSVCASARHVTTSPNPSLCKWRDDGCYYCYSYRTARWDQQYCNGDSDG